jgi:hypothetical protein
LFLSFEARFRLDYAITLRPRPLTIRIKDRNHDTLPPFTIRKEEKMARASKVFIVGCVALLLAGTAAADVGNLNFSYSVMTVGSDQVDFALQSSTTGTSYGFPFEWISNSVWISYYSTGYGWYWWSQYDWEYRTSATTSPAVGYRMALASNFSFSGLPPGWIWYSASGRARGYTYPYYSITTTYDYAYGNAFLGVNIPTAGQFGLMLLGLALAASGVILLRRA